MKAAAFEYVRAISLPDALKELTRAKPISGSQSMGPMLNLRLARPGRVVDVSRIADLRSVSDAGDHVRIGAAVTHAEIEDGKHAQLRHPYIQHVAGGIA